jgi:hypothetical protein
VGEREGGGGEVSRLRIEVWASLHAHEKILFSKAEDYTTVN